MRISWNEVAKIVKRGEKSVQTNKSEKQHKVNVTVTKLWDLQAGKTWVLSPFACSRQPVWNDSRIWEANVGELL